MPLVSPPPIRIKAADPKRGGVTDMLPYPLKLRTINYLSIIDNTFGALPPFAGDDADSDLALAERVAGAEIRPERPHHLRQLGVVHIDLVRAGQSAARLDQRAVAFLLLRRHLLIGNLGIASERGCLGHWLSPVLKLSVDVEEIHTAFFPARRPAAGTARCSATLARPAASVQTGRMLGDSQRGCERGDRVSPQNFGARSP